MADEGVTTAKYAKVLPKWKWWDKTIEKIDAQISTLTGSDKDEKTGQ